MSSFKDFIDTVKGPDFGGFNAIEYANGGQEIYLSFKALLKWVSENANLYSNGEEIIKVDWESNKPMFLYSTSVSCNLQTCYIRNGYLNTTAGTVGEKTTGIGNFNPIDYFENDSDNKYSTLQNTVRRDAKVTTDPSLYPYIGNINNIYINIALLSSEITEGTKGKNETTVSIREYLQNICDKVNKALGSINDLQVVSDVDGLRETLTIIDYQQKRIKDLTKSEPPVEIKAQGLGSMLTSIQAQSSITPEIATMISVGAQAQGEAVGVEATSFSRLSQGLEDRVYPTKGIGEEGKQGVIQENPLESRFRSAVNSYSKLVSNQIPTPEDTFGPVFLESTDKFDIQNIAVEFYKSALSKFTQAGQTSTAFIPIKLDFTLYGISGIKIFQKFKLSNDILPLSYKGDFEFIVTGVSHTVDNSKWETSISSLITLKDRDVDEDKVIQIPITVPLPKLSGYNVSKIRTEEVAGIKTQNGEVPNNLLTELSNSSKYKGDLSSDGGRIRLLTPIMRNLERMLVAYEKEYPNTPIKINSAFRTYSDQVRVRKSWEEKGKPQNAAYPGRSNHGFGRAVDFADKNLSKLTTSMVQYKWLAENAGKYGFTRIGKGDTEAWHWEDLTSYPVKDFK